MPLDSDPSTTPAISLGFQNVSCDIPAVAFFSSFLGITGNTPCALGQQIVSNANVSAYFRVCIRVNGTNELKLIETALMTFPQS